MPGPTCTPQCLPVGALDEPVSTLSGASGLMYAFDPSERPTVGLRNREWTAVGQTEVECVREMARCLREIGEGRVPK